MVVLVKCGPLPEFRGGKATTHGTKSLKSTEQPAIRKKGWDLLAISPLVLEGAVVRTGRNHVLRTDVMFRKSNSDAQ